MSDENRELAAAIRKASPENGAILDEIADLKSRVEVVDKRRIREEIVHAILESDLATAEAIMGAPSFSPSSDPNKPSTMDFGTASRLVAEGKRVTRLSWDNPEIYLIMFMWGQINPKTPNGKYLSIHHADGVMNPLYLNDGDLLGDDWVLV